MTEPQRIPAVEVWHGTATPGEQAAFEQAMASARDDLRTLRENYRQAVRAIPGGQDRVMARYVLGLLEWDPLDLAMALTRALMELEQR